MNIHFVILVWMLFALFALIIVAIHVHDSIDNTNTILCSQIRHNRPHVCQEYHP